MEESAQKGQTAAQSADGPPPEEKPPQVLFVFTASAPLLCVHLRKNCELSRNSARLLDACLRRVPGSPSRLAFQARDYQHGRNLEQLHRKAESMGGMDGFTSEEYTLEGPVGKIQAVGVAKDKELRERALRLAMSMAIVLQLKRAQFETIFNSYPDLPKMVEQAEGFLGDKAEKLQSIGVSSIQHSLWKWAKWEHQWSNQSQPKMPSTALATLRPSLKVSPSSHIDVNGSGFVIVSDQPKWGALESYKEGVADYLKEQKSLLIDFLHHGKIFFATLKPTSVVHWSRTSVWQNSEIGEKNSDEIGVILDMTCPANIDLLKQLLANQRILKVCWDCQKDVEVLCELLNVDIEANVDNVSEHVGNVLDAQKAFGKELKVSLSDCFNKCPPVSDADGLDLKRTRDHVRAEEFSELAEPEGQSSFEVSLLNHAAHKVLAIEVVISRRSPICTYDAAWARTYDLLREVWQHEQERHAQMAMQMEPVAKPMASSEVWVPPPRQTTSWQTSSLVTKEGTKASKITPSLLIRDTSTMSLKDQDDQRPQVLVPPGPQAPAPEKCEPPWIAGCQEHQGHRQKSQNPSSALKATEDDHQELLPTKRSACRQLAQPIPSDEEHDQLLQSLLKKAISSADLPAVPPSLTFELNCNRFIIASDRPDFMQGRCTGSETYEGLFDLASCLKNQKSLLVDFQGEMIGHAGEIYCAVLKPTMLPWQWKETGYSIEINPVASTDQAIGLPPCPGFILDMACPANVELLKGILDDPDILKVMWACQHDFEGLFFEHPSIQGKTETADGVQNVLDAELFFCPGDQPLIRSSNFVSLSEQLKEVKRGNSVEMPDFPDRDTYHACNERCPFSRRPFLPTFFKNAAREVLALEEIALHGTPLCTYSEAWIRTGKTIQEVWRDRHGLQVLQQQRMLCLEALVPLTVMAKAMTVKYFRHFARVQSVAETELQKDERELAKHNDLMGHLKTWGLELREIQMRFQGDDVDELICKTMRNFELTKEDENRCRQMATHLFPNGVTMFRFRDRPSLLKWAQLAYHQCGFDLQQDSQAFFVEKTSAENIKERALLSHVDFPTGVRYSLDHEGCWWGLKTSVRKSPRCETEKRALQAIVWLLMKEDWAQHGHRWVVVACDIARLQVQPRCVRTVFYFDPKDLIFKRSTLQPTDATHYLRFSLGGMLSGSFMIEELTEKWIFEAVQQQAIKWNLKSYVAECMWYEAGVGEAVTFMTLIEIIQKQGGLFQKVIAIRLREVNVRFICGGWHVADRPLYPFLKRMDSFAPAATCERIVEMVAEISAECDWSHGVWGFLTHDGQLMELTQDTVDHFICSCWTDSQCPLSLSIHLQDAFAEINGKRHPLQVRRLSEDAVFHAIYELASKLFSGQDRKAMYWWDGQYVEFAWESRRSFFQTFMSSWTHLRPLYFCLEAW